MHTTNDSAFAGNREPEKTAGKRPRLVILVRDGLLEMVATDQEIDIEILKVDADDQAEEETIYRIETVEVDTRAVEYHFRKAEEFWKREEESETQQKP